MNLSSLLHQISLEQKQSEMIREYVEANHIEINTFIVISRKKMLENDLSPDSPRIDWIQSGELIEKNQIKSNLFFFAIMDGCGMGKVLVIPDPPTD